jgi:hypothetical protein
VIFFAVGQLVLVLAMAALVVLGGGFRRGGDAGTRE